MQDLAFDANGKLLVGVQHTQVVFRQTHGLSFQPTGNTPRIDINGFNNDAASVAGSPTDPNVILVAMTSGQSLLRTENGGRSWTSAAVAGSPTSYVNSRMAFPTSSRVYLAIPTQPQPGLYRSDDAGQTFAPSSSGLAGAGVHGLAQDARGTLFVWLRGGGLFSSNDGASTWHPVDTGEALQRSGVEAGRGALVADPRHPGCVYLGNAGVIQIDTGDD